MIEMLLSGGGGGGVPAGTIIGFSGTLAQARALNDWAICDGTNNTPDLNGRMIIGASGDYPFGSEGQGGRVGGTSGSTTGSHLPSSTWDFTGGMENSTLGENPDINGGHSHTLQTSTIPNPAARQTLFIQAIRETHIPQYGVVWMESVPRQGVVVDNTIFNRFLVGVTNSARGNIGNDSLTLELTTSSSGMHIHRTSTIDHTRITAKATTAGSYLYITYDGSHTHTVASQTVTAVPPWYGLIPGKVEEILAPWKGLVVAYNGSLTSLPAPWREFTQLRGRFPRGAATPGSNGGTAQQTVSATPGSSNFLHSHQLGDYKDYGKSSKKWSHSHYTHNHSHDSMSLTYSNLPPYKALHYIAI